MLVVVKFTLRYWEFRQLNAFDAIFLGFKDIIKGINKQRGYVLNVTLRMLNLGCFFELGCNIKIIFQDYYKYAQWWNNNLVPLGW